MAGIKGINTLKQDLYFGKDIQINDDITIHQPTVREILEFHINDDSGRFPDGEIGYYKFISLITATPADYDVQLDDAGIRYEDVDELEFFFGLVTMFGLTQNVTKILFGDLDLTKFQRYKNDQTGQSTYINDAGVKIDKMVYQWTMQIVRTMLNLSVNHTTWQNEASRAMHMDMERKRSKRRHHDKPKSVLIPIISMLVNDPGFKYNREQCLDLNINFVYDSLKQRMHYQAVDHLMTGVYVGLIDTKKMNLSDELNFIRKDEDF